MHKTTAVNIFSIFRYLPVAVFFLAIFFLPLSKAGEPSTPNYQPTAHKAANNLVLAGKQKASKSQVTAFKAIKASNNAFEFTLPLLNLSVPHQVTAFQMPNLVYSFSFKKELLLAGKVSGFDFSFISRFFPVSILPNAP